jgi:hypothetical protein
LVLSGYLWAFIETKGFQPSKEPDGFYGMLTDALLSGQLHLKVEPDPRLAQLDNPWLSYQGIPRLHDATYFHGHYYVYFGITPVILYFAPVKILTGKFPYQGSAGVLFAFVGFLAGLWLLRRLIDLQENQPSAGWKALGIIVWGYANYAFVDCQSVTFYTVPILCAFACLMVALAAIERALSSSKVSTAAGFIMAASLCWGLAVGGRPQYVLSLPLLAIPVIFLLARESGQWAKGKRRALLASALVPAAVIGAGLAWYNYARFGSVSEFGFRYQFTGSDNRFIQMWNPRLILPNLGRYSLSDALYMVYFPFFAPVGIFIGFFAWCPFSGLAALLPLSLFERRLRTDPRWICVAFCTAAAGAIHLFSLCILPIGVDRYDVDFLPEFLLAALFTAIAYFGVAPRWPRVARILASVVLAAAAAVSVSKLLSLALDRTPNAAQRRVIATALNWPTAAVQSLTGGLKGPSELDLSFATLPQGIRTPLIATGIGNDVLFAEGIDKDHLRLGFIHLGNDPIYGPAFAVKPGEHRQVVADLGSFYPPDTHPLFRHWDPDLLDAMHRRILVMVDGETVLAANSYFYPSDPSSIVYCSLPGKAIQVVPFSGILYKVTRLAVPSEAEIRTAGWVGPVRLHLRFPKFEHVHSEPLLSTGSAQAADMIYVTYLGPNRLLFGHDSTHGGGVESAAVDYDPAVEHVLDIGLGSLEAPAGTLPSANMGLRLKFDGRWLIAIARPTHPSYPYQNLFGYNSGLGSAEESFSGSLVPEHIEASYPSANGLPGEGPVEVSLRFVPMPSDISEPLVVSGVTGRGDIVFVRYLADSKIQFGVDHWSVGLKLSESIPFQEGTVYTLTVSSAAFLPAADSTTWASTPRAVRDHLLSSIELFLDGKKILDAAWTGYDASASQLSIGKNPIGGSTTGPSFSGVVLSARHRPLSEFLSMAKNEDSGSDNSR